VLSFVYSLWVEATLSSEMNQYQILDLN